MAKDKSLIVEPPAIQRLRETSADQEVVKNMADTIRSDDGLGAWVSNGDIYSAHHDAALDAGIYKRAVARALGVQDFKMRTRTWGMKNGTVELDTEAKGAEWRFAVKFDPERQKRVRNKS